jgi:diguanylate cyclase (GGDEF)-like protein
VAVARAWPNHTPLELGIAGALVAFFIASTWVADLRIYSLFMMTAGALLVTAVLQESHRMAFRDGLTGLPNRRALEEELRALAPPYAVAMVDVDHFKKFNDTYGHDIGDQVLRLVAARLAESSGGGRAFRYGGEEFTVLFKGKRLAEALPHLEAARAAVEAYKMTIRGQDRPKDKKEGSKRRAKEDFARTDMILSVTVSIGAAEPGKRMKTPAEVVKGADEALYRAKERGRNQVSR